MQFAVTPQPHVSQSEFDSAQSSPPRPTIHDTDSVVHRTHDTLSLAFRLAASPNTSSPPSHVSFDSGSDFEFP